MGLVVSPHRSHQKHIEGQHDPVNQHGQHRVDALRIQHQGDEQKKQIQQRAEPQHVAPKELRQRQPAVPAKRPESFRAGRSVHGQRTQRLDPPWFCEVCHAQQRFMGSNYREPKSFNTCGSISAHSSSVNKRDRVWKALPVLPSKEKVPPEPSITSRISCVLFQYAYCD